jgi:hypothetical protein
MVGFLDSSIVGSIQKYHFLMISFIQKCAWVSWGLGKLNMKSTTNNRSSYGRSTQTRHQEDSLASALGMVIDPNKKKSTSSIGPKKKKSLLDVAIKNITPCNDADDESESNDSA